MKWFLLYLDKLCNDALGNTIASLCSEMMPDQEAQSSDPTGSNGNLKEEQNHNMYGHMSHEGNRNEHVM